MAPLKKRPLVLLAGVGILLYGLYSIKTMFRPKVGDKMRFLTGDDISKPSSSSHVSVHDRTYDSSVYDVTYRIDEWPMGSQVWTIIKVEKRS